MRKVKFINVLLALFILFLFNCQKQSTSGESHRFTSINELTNNFQNPPLEYRTAPFWIWHDKVSEKEIDIQLEDFKGKGIGGVFIHPRYGLITEYLSDEWFDLIAYAVAKAKELGMQAWLYDENSFPSGFAGGHVPAEMPESYNKGQGLVLDKASVLPDDIAEKYTLILKKSGNAFIEILDPANEKSGKGEYYLFRVAYYGKSKWYGGFSYVDLIYPGVTDKFIELTMTGYEKSIGKEFGKTVPGIFTDEPNISTPQGKNCIRWTPDLFDRFHERWGYDLKICLPSLFDETGDWRRIRHNYYATLLELFIERWSKPWYQYTETHNLKWTGHYWEHGWPSPHHGGDNMAMYAWHQVPAIDMLFNTFSEDGVQFGNVRAVKELASVANQMDRRRALSETYGAAGWELRFEDMKRLGDWEYALGVNFMNQHLSYMTLMGDRKHDFPQAFSYHEPWWPFYRYMADYYARLSMLLASGRQVNKTLVLEPTTSTWMYYSSVKSNQRFGEIGAQFTDFLNRLEKLQIEYDLGCENIINDHGKIIDGKFAVGERIYEIVVLPPGMDNLNAPTFALLEKFLQQGGKVLCFTEPPDYINGVKTDKCRNLAESNKNSWLSFNSVTENAANRLISTNIQFTNPDNSGGLLFHHRRLFDDGQLLFLVNSSLDEASKGELFIKGASVQVMNAITGETGPYPALQTGNKLKISFDLLPANSLALLVNNSGVQEVTEENVQAARIIQTEDPGKILRTKPNTFTLDYCTLKLGDNVYENIYFYTASFKIFQHYGFEDNPWVSSSQYKTDILDKDNFGEDTGFEAVFPFEIDSDLDTDGLKVVAERPDLFKISVNEHPVQPIKGEWFLDRSFAVYDIASLVTSGKNNITIIRKPMSIHAELEPVYLLGDFGLLPVEHGWKLTPAEKLTYGAWNEQGLPFYADGVAYSKTYKLSAGKNYKVSLSGWNGSVAEVRVNEKSAGIIGWQPYEVDISAFVKDGDNDIKVVVYGTLKNLLGPHHNVRNRGIVTPWSFKYAPEIQPKGLEYDVLEYGLYSDFTVTEIQ
ncbi:hypothetical protein JXQ31_05655 [candidate division KSB1 bacterium]|nr:hypothetical protein [candidate division KSB1 bacterium]